MTAVPRLAVIPILAISFFVSVSILSGMSSSFSLNGTFGSFTCFNSQDNGQRSGYPTGDRYKWCHIAFLIVITNFYKKTHGNKRTPLIIVQQEDRL